MVENAAIFAQAAKEQDLELIVDMSHKQSRPAARSEVTQAHWLSEQIFDRSGVPSVHLRPTFFAEWLLYVSGIIRYGRYIMPFNTESRFAPIAGFSSASSATPVLIPSARTKRCNIPPTPATSGNVTSAVAPDAPSLMATSTPGCNF